MDQGILKIQRRFAKRGSEDADRGDKEDAKGYASFSEFAKDVAALIDLIWVSGTRRWTPVSAMGDTTNDAGSFP